VYVSVSERVSVCVCACVCVCASYPLTCVWVPHGEWVGG